MSSSQGKYSVVSPTDLSVRHAIGKRHRAGPASVTVVTRCTLRGGSTVTGFGSFGFGFGSGGGLLIARDGFDGIGKRASFISRAAASASSLRQSSASVNVLTRRSPAPTSTKPSRRRCRPRRPGALTFPETPRGSCPRYCSATLPIFCTAATRRALSLSTKAVNSGASW